MRIALTDPPGAALHRWYRDGDLRSEGESITEGIGQGRVTGNLVDFTPDLSFEIPDADSLRCAFALLRDEGLAVGLSSGTNVAGAMRVAEALGPGHTVVTILCDLAHRYASKMFNTEYLEARGLPTPSWLTPAEPDDIDAALARAQHSQS